EAGASEARSTTPSTPAANEACDRKVFPVASVVCAATVTTASGARPVTEMCAGTSTSALGRSTWIATCVREGVEVTGAAGVPARGVDEVQAARTASAAAAVTVLLTTDSYPSQSGRMERAQAGARELLNLGARES